MTNKREMPFLQSEETARASNFVNLSRASNKLTSKTAQCEVATPGLKLELWKNTFCQGIQCLLLIFIYSL